MHMNSVWQAHEGAPKNFFTLLAFTEMFAPLSSGAQPALHFGGGAIFMKFHSMTSSCLFNRGATCSQIVTDKVLFATFPKMRTFQF